MMASTLAISVSRLLRPLSDNPSRKSLRLRAHAATIASAYSYEWGGERIAVEDLRRFAHISDDRELVLDGDHDEVLAPGSTLDLSKRGAERIRSRRVQPKDVTIIVNGREKSVPRGLISYERIVELAFGTEAPAVTHTVNWRLRDGDEGSLVVGQTVEVRQGMIFNATATNRS